MHPRQVFLRTGANVLRRRDFLAAGIEPRQLAAAVHDGSLIRARIGHYVLPGTHGEVLRATRIGGLAAGVSAGDALGWWRPPSSPAQVWLRVNASRLRDPECGHAAFRAQWSGDVDLLWGKTLVAPDPRTGVVAPIDAIRQAVGSTSSHYAVAIVDSALRARSVSRAQLASLAEHDNLVKRAFAAADPTAESGTESVVRRVLVEAGFRVRAQPRFEGVGRVDLLVGDRVLVEVDSKEWHGTPQQRSADYARDLELLQRGYLVVRLTYRQALYDHPAVIAAVGRALLTVSGL